MAQLQHQVRKFGSRLPPFSDDRIWKIASCVDQKSGFHLKYWYFFNGHFCRPHIDFALKLIMSHQMNHFNVYIRHRPNRYLSWHISDVSSIQHCGSAKHILLFWIHLFFRFREGNVVKIPKSLCSVISANESVLSSRTGVNWSLLYCAKADPAFSLSKLSFFSKTRTSLKTPGQEKIVMINGNRFQNRGR